MAARKLNSYDQHTKELSRPPVRRRDALPPSDNPITAFREELRMNEEQFADYVRVTVSTVKNWSRHEERRTTPNGPTLQRILRLARENRYPLYLRDIWAFYGIDPEA